MEDARRHVLHNLARRRSNVDVLPVNVIPRATGEDGHVVRQVEERGDQGQAEEEEDDGVCERGRSAAEDAEKGPNRGAQEPGRDSQKANFSQGVNM